MSSLDKQIGRSLRGSRRDAFRDLLAGKVFSANRVADPLKRIIKLCGAARLGKTHHEDLDLDLERIDGIFEVAVCLDGVDPVKRSYEVTYPVAWSFVATEQNYQRLIAPWAKNYQYWPDLLRNHIEWRTAILCRKCGYTLLDVPYHSIPKHKHDYQSEKRIARAEALLRKHEKGEWTPCPNCKESIIEGHGWRSTVAVEFRDYKRGRTKPEWSFFFEASHYLTREGYKMLTHSFVSWASRTATEIEEKLAPLIDADRLLYLFKTEEEEEETLGD